MRPRLELGASRRARTRKAHQRVRLRFLLLDIEPTATPYAVYLCLCDCLGAAPCPSNRERVVMPPCLFSVRAPRPWTQSVGQLIPPPVSHSWSASPFACLLPALPSALSRRSRRRWIATLEANSSLRHDPWTQSGPWTSSAICADPASGVTFSHLSLGGFLSLSFFLFPLLLFCSLSAESVKRSSVAYPSPFPSTSLPLPCRSLPLLSIISMLHLMSYNWAGSQSLANFSLGHLTYRFSSLISSR